jgi:plasmid maintenance system antidote protein VapI
MMATARKRASLRTEKALLKQAVRGAIVQAMADRGINRTTLAGHLEKSTPDVTQLLRGNRNMRIDTIVTLAYALGLRARIVLEP